MKKYRNFLGRYSGGAILFVLLFALTIGSLSTAVAWADEVQQKKQQLNQLNDQIAAQRKELQAVQEQANGVTAQITALEKKIEETEGELVTISQNIDSTQLEIQRKEARLVELQEKIKQDQEILGERLCVIYEEGECNYLEVLLQAASLQDFLTRVDYLNAILDNDQSLIQTTNQMKGEVQTEKASLEEQKQQLEKDKVEEAAKKQALEQQRSEQQAILADIQVDLDKQKKALDELESESSMLSNLIRNIESSSSAGSIVQGTGVFLWPSNASRTITSEYGWRYHPTLHYNKLHTGMDIGAGYGTDVLAADSGTVIFAGWNNAYGKMVIISHGGNISTLYAHQSSLLVSEGQSVQRGQVIGKVGSTGYSTGPHLHFEVRINGSTVNPRGYL